MSALESAAGTPPDQPQAWWRRHASWLGPLITLFGFLSYFLYFYQYPATRDFPIVNLPLVLLGLGLSALGCWSLLKNRARLLRKLLGGLGLLFSFGLTGLLIFYVFYYSYQLPESTAAPAVKTPAPDFTLTDANGEPVTLSSLRGKKVIIDFYRGNW